MSQPDAEAFVACEGHATALDPAGLEYGGEGQIFSAEEIQAYCDELPLVDIDGDVMFTSGGGVNDLTGLRCLQAITGNLVISDFEAVLDFSDLSGLLAAGGLDLRSNGAITSLSGLEALAPALGSISIIEAGALHDLSALECSNAMSSVSVRSAAMTDFSGFSGLKVVDGAISFSDLPELEDASLPSLTSAGDFEISSAPRLRDVELPDLAFASALSFATNDVLLTIDVPLVAPRQDRNDFTVHLYDNAALERVEVGAGEAGIPLVLEIAYCPELRTVVGLGGYTELESLYLSFDAALTTLPALAVESASRDVTIEYTALESLDFLAKLKTVGGSLEIVGNPNLSQADAEAFAAAITVEGTVKVWDNGP